MAGRLLRVFLLWLGALSAHAARTILLLEFRHGLLPLSVAISLSVVDLALQLFFLEMGVARFGLVSSSPE